MKFTITFKTPDAVEEAINEHLRYQELDEDTAAGIDEEMRGTAEDFVKYGEYVTVEFDTVAHSATVLKVK